MSVITVDFETYYDAAYSLSKISMEEYLRSPKFECIGVGISIGGRPPQWYDATRAEQALQEIDWHEHSLLCWNTAFDGAILAWHFGITPRLYLDAMGMARACGHAYKGGSLAKVVEVLGVGIKGDEVVHAMGKHLADFTPTELARYGEYCCNDVELTNAIYRQLILNFPLSELRLQDQVLRMFIEPVLNFNISKLREHHTDVVNKKWEGLAKAAAAVGLEWEGMALPADGQLLQTYNELSHGGVLETLRGRLASNQQLAELLLELGVDPPQKLSKTTGLLTWAFAKSDPDFAALAEHDSPEVQAVVAARLGVKSTIEETRAERFLGVAERGPWPVPYIYYSAHTGRLGGGDKVNPQNLRRGGKLREAILPPPGHLLIAGDLSQIECRILNYISGQDDVIEAFRANDAGTGPDVYCIFASKIYQCDVTPEDKPKRTVGKIGELSLGYGAGKDSYRSMLFAQARMHIPVHEAKNVVDIYRTTHNNNVRLWDQGAQALHALLSDSAFTFGRDDLLIVRDGGIQLPNGLALRYPQLQKRMNENGQVEFVYLQKNKWIKTYGARVIENCIAVGTEVLTNRGWVQIERVGVKDLVHDGVEFVRHAGVVFKSVQACVKVEGVSMTPDHEVLIDGGWKKASELHTRYEPPSCVLGVAEYARSLSPSYPQSVEKLRRSGDYGMPTMASVVSSVLERHGSYVQTGARLGSDRQQWDLLPDELSMGYSPPQYDEQTHYYSHDRRSPVSSENWYQSQHYLLSNSAWLAGGSTAENTISYQPVFDILNCGPRQRFVVRGNSGPMIVHNCVQALARIVMTDAWLRIAQRYRVVLSTHDELVCIAPIADAEECRAFMQRQLTWPVVWLPGMPIACTTGIGENYGACK